MAAILPAKISGQSKMAAIVLAKISGYITARAIQADAYCLCGEGEHGLMISCDGENCRIFWFHVNCVGLSEESVPDGSWYCQLCKH